MTEEQLDKLCYPVGKFSVPTAYTPADIATWKNDIKELPALLRAAVAGLTDEQLATPYRPDGWTLRQVVHHMADSHLNSIIRFKWALTEDNPTIKAYNQTAWAELPDYQLPLEPSLLMLDGIHARLTALLNNLTDEQWDKTFVHPESGATISLKRNLALYSWHGKHHVAHITQTTKNF